MISCQYFQPRCLNNQLQRNLLMWIDVNRTNFIFYSVVNGCIYYRRYIFPAVFSWIIYKIRCTNFCTDIIILVIVDSQMTISGCHIIYIYIYMKMSLKQHGHFATNGFVFPLIRQMLINHSYCQTRSALLAAAILKCIIYIYTISYSLCSVLINWNPLQNSK